MQNARLPFITLICLISFASVNAVLYTPALPDISRYFAVSDGTAQLTMTWFLVGYALGQLIYGPLANRFGRKPALFVGILMQIVSSLLCILAHPTHCFYLLVGARFLTALGAGVGLKMTFTLVNETYNPRQASQKIAYLMLAFAMTPAIGVSLGGLLNHYSNWTACFYAGALYGVMLLLLARNLPETLIEKDYSALNVGHLLRAYKKTFECRAIIAGGMLMGCATCFVYVFAALAPFIAVNIYHMTSAHYGILNLLPPIGLILGSFYSIKHAKKHSLQSGIRLGIGIGLVSGLIMSLAMYLHLPVILALFCPLIISYFGLSLIFSNASTFALQAYHDKSNGSAVLNFINMGIATLIVMGSSLMKISAWLLPGLFLLLSLSMIAVFYLGLPLKSRTQG